MKTATIRLLLAASLFACLATHSFAFTLPEISPQSAACIACHSPTGKGNAPAGYPALAGQHAQYVADQLRAYRQGYEDPAGRTNDGDTKIMRATAFGLSDLEIEAVSSYVSGLQ